jgi:CheY-like chemotaxis protein
MSLSKGSGVGPRVLIVEDEFLIRMTLVEALGDEGFDCVEAESADAALPMLQADPGIRLLLTDIKLPGVLDGRALARRAREQIPNLPIVFMTGQPDPEDRPTALEVFIAKPYTLNDICDAARRLTATAASP